MEENKERLCSHLRGLINFYKLERVDTDNDPCIKDLNVALAVVSGEGNPSSDEIKRSLQRLESLVSFYEKITLGIRLWETINDQTTPPKLCKVDFCPMMWARTKVIEPFGEIVALLRLATLH